MTDVFISYSREDSNFVRLLDRELRSRGRETWVDWEGIRPAEEFMAAIFSAIESAQAFVFVISPASAASDICARELAHALDCRKRLIPVVCREVHHPASIPPALRTLNWISFLKESQLRSACDKLLSALDTDLAWVRTHTRLLARALEWDRRDRNVNLMLRGDDLAGAEQALAESAGKDPPAVALQREYVLASREEARQNDRRQEAATRLSGEIEAAGRVQRGTLPTPRVAFPDEKRFTIYARSEAARMLGGDLYDFFRLDENRVMFLIGDVSGKGAPASLLMAVCKAFFKSIALRQPGTVAEVMRAVDRELARDNQEALFVTAFAGILDARSGHFEYCNAGFEVPYVLSAVKGPLRRLGGGEGPPLCVLDAFEYKAASYAMRPEETLCFTTDGVTEASNAAGALYGHERLQALLAGLHRPIDAERIGDAIHRGVSAFTAGSERADDQTILVVRWNGSQPQ